MLYIERPIFVNKLQVVGDLNGAVHTGLVKELMNAGPQWCFQSQNIADSQLGGWAKTGPHKHRVKMADRWSDRDKSMKYIVFANG